MSLTLTQSLKQSEIFKLKPNAHFPFKNFDYVCYLDKDSKRKYCQIEYDNYLCAFILNHYTDGNFTTPVFDKNEYPHFDFIYEIGLENLNLL